MKILMVSDFYHPFIGGMENEVKLISEGLFNKNCEIIICTIGNDFLPKFQNENGIRIYRLKGLFQQIPFLYKNPKKKYPPPIADLVLTNHLRNIIKYEKPDIIHTHGWILYSLLPIKKQLKQKLVTTFHDFGFICPNKWSSQHSKGICNRPLTHKCITCSLQNYGLLKSFFTYFGIKLNKTFNSDAIIFSNPNLVNKMNYLNQNKYYLEHPINENVYKPININIYKERILCWTKLDRNKGINIIYKIAKNMPEYQFDISYIGNDKEYYKKK